MITTTEELRKLIAQAIMDRTEEIIKEEQANLNRVIERRVKESTGLIVARVLEHFTFEKFQTELRITVDFQKKVAS